MQNAELWVLPSRPQPQATQSTSHRCPLCLVPSWALGASLPHLSTCDTLLTTLLTSATPTPSQGTALTGLLTPLRAVHPTLRVDGHRRAGHRGHQARPQPSLSHMNPALHHWTKDACV